MGRAVTAPQVYQTRRTGTHPTSRWYTAPHAGRSSWRRAASAAGKAGFERVVPSRRRPARPARPPHRAAERRRRATRAWY